MNGDLALGQVITFYSYKGGTGRSMALANTACLLAREAEEGRGVLMVDWDLDAPGLHEYFRSRFQRQFANAQEPDRELERHPGVIDLFKSFNEALKQIPSDRPQTRDEARKLVRTIDPLGFVLKTDVPGLHLLKAGKFDAGYSAGVSTFLWEGLYKRSPWLVWAFAERLTERYRYVLVDSRTGLNDISGICTMILPEKLVTVFTPNRQSLDGIYDLVRRATNYRRQSPDLRPLVAFPLPARIDAQRSELRKTWRYGDPNKKIFGFQPAFEQLFREIYDLEECSLEDYLGEVQIQHTPDFAYGEEVAVLTEWGSDRFDLTRSYERFADVLVHSRVPWTLSLGSASQDQAQKRARAAEAAFIRLSPTAQEIAQRILTRFVRLAPPGEGGRDAAIAYPSDEFAGFIALVRDQLVDQQVLNDENGQIELADESLIETWPRLGRWLQEDREFLLWRQGLRNAMAAWEQAGKPLEGLLTGKFLEEALRWRETRPEGLDSSERYYIFSSETQQTRRAFLIGLAGGLAALTVGGVSIWGEQAFRVNLYQSLLESWDLPADLYERLGQLRTLTLSSDVNRVDWLPTNLENLTLLRSRVESLEGLPSSLRSLEITGTTIASLKGLPAGLRSLAVGLAYPPVLSELPPELKSLSLSQELLHEPQGLPETLRQLALEAPLRSLAGLPRSLEDLSLTGAQVEDLSGLPPKLKSLELRYTAVVSLKGLPASVKTLTLVQNSRLREGELPPRLLSLRLQENLLFDPAVIPIPRTLKSLFISSRWNARFPDGLETLGLLSDSAGPYTGWPQGLERLQVPELSYDRIPVHKTLRALTLDPASNGSMLAMGAIEEFLPLLQELDVGRLDLYSLRDLPTGLQILRARMASDHSPLLLPSTLMELDLTGSRISRLPKLPLGLRRLSLGGTLIASLGELPPGLEVLDISDTRIVSLGGLPPRLRKLTLTVGQVSSLEGLPETVDELVFLEDLGKGANKAFK